MSDDIVEYLRLSRTRFNRHAEAADEIERLRAELIGWKKLAQERNPHSWRNLVRRRYGMEGMYER